jgi:hypothetical protein
MFDWVYSAPLEVAALTMAVIFVGFTWAGSIFVAPILRAFVRSRAGTNGIVGNILSSFGVLYGILLGLTAVAAYQNWSGVQSIVVDEAGALLAVYTEVSSFPEPVRSELNAAIVDIVETTMSVEWDRLSEGDVFVGTAGKVADLRSQLITFEPSGGAETLVHGQAIAHFTEFVEHRRHRVYSATAGIPAVFWYVVIIGAAINVMLVWLLDMRLVSQFFLGGLLSFYLGAIILLIARLDQPFRSVDGVSPQAFEALYRVMTSSG